MKVEAAIASGVGIGLLTYLGFAMYAWTALHSGWSSEAIHRFQWLTYNLPWIVGIGAAGGVYWLSNRRE